MNRPVSPAQDLGKIIADMEENVADVGRWATAIQDLGTCGVSVDTAGLYVIGKAMVAASQSLIRDWEKCFDLSRHLRGGGQ